MVCRHGFEARQCSECNGPELPGHAEIPSLWREVLQRSIRIAELEQLVARANEVARQAQEIADQRGRRIMELQDALARGQEPEGHRTERVAAWLRSKGYVVEPPIDAVEFPVNALRHSL